jgi:hypothetical protein
VDYIGVVVIVDVVTDRHTILHNELVQRLGALPALELAEGSQSHAASYRQVLRNNRHEIRIWMNCFTFGNTMPTMPLRLIVDSHMRISGGLEIDIGTYSTDKEAPRRPRETATSLEPPDLRRRVRCTPHRTRWDRFRSSFSIGSTNSGRCEAANGPRTRRTARSGRGVVISREHEDQCFAANRPPTGTPSKRGKGQASDP